MEKYIKEALELGYNVLSGFVVMVKYRYSTLYHLCLQLVREARFSHAYNIINI